MDYQITQYLKSKVEEYMADGQSFTSLDIANQAKDAGFQVRNYQVAEWLRSNVIPTAFASGFLYNQALIRVDSKAVGITLAYLYHHYEVDADTYLDRDQNPKSMQKQTPASLGRLDTQPSVQKPVSTPVSTGRRIVEQRSMDGTLIGSFNTATEAATATGVGVSGISKAARGVRNSAGGFKWAYV